VKIKNIEGMSAGELQVAVNQGAKFVHYIWTVSAIVVTIKRPSAIYMVRRSESRFSKGYIFTVVSFLFGWWGIPFGPKHTLASLRTNFKGGKDVTEEVMSIVAGYALYEENKKGQQQKKAFPAEAII
jgi:hypothetical protein